MRKKRKNGFFMIELMVTLWLLSFILLGICEIYVNTVKTKIKIEQKINEIDFINKSAGKKDKIFDSE